MNEALNWKMPKWPFWAIYLIFIVAGFIFARQAPHALGHWEVFVTCVVAGALICIIPYILDYRWMGKVIEVNGLGAVAEKIQNLDQFCAQISAATGRWAAVQEFVGENAEKTASAAKQIADKMSAEVRDFSEFMQKTNDGEKAALRLEVEKLRRGESEWLKTVVGIFDHTFAMHSAAVRANQPKVAEQISQFQNACQGAARRLGLNGFVAQPNEPFDAARHKSLDSKENPDEGAAIAETVAAGYTFQGKLLRPALVHMREGAPAPSATPLTKNTPETAPAVPATKEKAPVEPAAKETAPVEPITPKPAKAPAPAQAQNTLALEVER